jgi:hypothetical protein
VALGGTTYAAVKIDGKIIERGTVSGTALKKDTLTGKQIKESSLGQVPSAKKATTAGFATTAGLATAATNASALGGVPAASYLTSGCGPGKINGYAQINGGAASFPKTYTSAAPFVVDSYNCSGQPVEVRRAFGGVYAIRFPGNPGRMGFANLSACPLTIGLLCVAEVSRTASVTPISKGPDTGGFQVEVTVSGTSSDVDGAVSVLIP